MNFRKIIAQSPIITIPLVVVLLLTHFTQFASASFGAWGDSSLINACEDGRGRVTLVTPGGASCLSYETEVSWLKDVDAGLGLSVSRSSDGATLSINPTTMPVSVARYQAGGAGISSPNASWQDVSGSAITQTFKAGKIRATFSGAIGQTNGDGTAYTRLKVEPTGGSVTYVDGTTIYKSSSPSNSENASTPFVMDRIVTVSAGEYTITPQVNINNGSWSLNSDNVLIIEQ